jgi:aminoglycoside phosphotransferase (APT) family kinase protein
MTPMTTQEELELAQRIVAGHYTTAATIEPLTRFNNPVFRVNLPDGARILKISKSVEGVSVRKETMIIARLARHGIPVADVEHVDQAGSLVGRPYFVMHSAGDQTVAELLGPGDVAQSLLREMGGTLARIHSVPGVEFADLPADRISASGVAKYLESLAETADALAQQSLLEPDEVARFRALKMPVAEGDSLCHSDYHAVQCIVRDGRLSAVVDWESAWIGNPAIDLAISHAYLDFYCPQPLTREFLAGYLSVRPIPEDYREGYLPARMAQLLGMMRAWFTRGADVWQSAVAQQRVTRAIRLFRVYLARLPR